MITDYFMITEKSNRLQVIMITDYDYPNSGMFLNKNARNPRFFSSLACNCVKVTATFFKIEEISKMTHFNIKFL